MPYGWRVLRALVFGCMLFAISAVIIWPINLETVPTELREEFYTEGIWAFLLIGWLILILTPPMNQKNNAMFDRLLCSDPEQTTQWWITMIPLFIVAFLFVGSLITMFESFGSFYQNPNYSNSEKAWETVFIALRYLLVMLPFAIGLFPVMLIGMKEKLKEIPVLRRWFKEGRGGISQWAGPATFDSHHHKNGLEALGGGILLGRTLFTDDFSCRDVSVADDGHMLTIGQPGSGKSVTAIWPNLALYGGSAIVIDPKGEHARMFTGRRQEPVFLNPDCVSSEGTPTGGHTRVKHHLNGRVFILDPFGTSSPYESSCYNPLSEIDIKSDNARKLISAVSGSSIVASSGENRFWEEAARAVLDGVIAHVLSTFPRHKQTLPHVADLLMGIDPKTGFADPEIFDELLIDMRMNNAVGGLPQMGASTLDDLGDRARGSVIAELRTSIKWATDPAMRKNLGHSSFSFASVGSQTTTVFIALPFGMMAEQMRWLRTIVEVSMRILEDRNKTSKTPVLYILDELPQYGAHLKAIKEGMVTLRSAGVKLWAFVQNMKQLETCFGEDGAKNFQSGGTVQVFGVSDDSTSEWVSKKLGQHRVADKKGWIRRKQIGSRETDLVSAAEVERVLGKTAPIQYVFRSGHPPMRLQRIAHKPLTIEGVRFKGHRLLRWYYDEDFDQ